MSFGKNGFLTPKEAVGVDTSANAAVFGTLSPQPLREPLDAEALRSRAERPQAGKGPR